MCRRMNTQLKNCCAFIKWIVDISNVILHFEKDSAVKFIITDAWLPSDSGAKTEDN